MSWIIEIVISPLTNHLSKALTVEVRKPNCTKNVREQIWNAKTPNRLTTLAGKKSIQGLKLPPCEQIHVEANMIITKYMCIAILPICRIFFW